LFRSPERAVSTARTKSHRGFTDAGTARRLDSVAAALLRGQQNPVGLADEQVTHFAAEGGEVGVAGERPAALPAVAEVGEAPQVDQRVQVADLDGVDPGGFAEVAGLGFAAEALPGLQVACGRARYEPVLAFFDDHDGPPGHSRSDRPVSTGPMRSAVPAAATQRSGRIRTTSQPRSRNQGRRWLSRSSTTTRS